MTVRTFPLGDVPEFVFWLWNEAFGDDEATVRHILFAADEIYGAFLPDGEAAGLACAFNVTAGERRGKYLYAVCTAERYRGRGVMRAVLSHAASEAERAGDAFAFLIPAKAEYFPMYEKMGFDHAYPGRIAMTGERVTVSAEEFAMLPTVPFDGDTGRLYELYLRSPQTVVKKGKKLFELSIEGCEVAYLSRNGVGDPEGYVIFEIKGKKSINILEMCACSGEISGIIEQASLASQCLGALSTYACAEKALFRFFDGVPLPAGTPIDLFLEL